MATIDSMDASDERRFNGRLVGAVLSAGLMSFCGIVVETAMNVTFPTLMSEFGIDISTVQWITTGYLLVLAVVMPVSSYLKRRYPTRSLFFFAIAVFIAATAGSACAPAFWVLLACRLLQGVGTGVAMPLMINIVLEQAPQDKMGMMMGVSIFIVACAPAAGPSIGGLIVTLAGWRGIFLALLVPLVLALVVGRRCITQAGMLVPARFDASGWALLAISFICLIVATSYLSVWGVGSPLFWGLIAGFAFFLALFVRHCHDTEWPLLHLEVLRTGTFSLSVVALFLLQFIVLGYGLLIPNYAQLVQGQSAFTAGCLLLPGCLLGAVLAPVSGRVFDRLGAVVPLGLGAACMFGAALGFALFHALMGNAAVIGCYMLFTLGQGLSAGNLLTYGIRYLAIDLSADGNAVASTLQQLAGAIGTAVMSTVVAAGQRGSAAGTAAYVAGTATGTRLAFAVAAVAGTALLVDVVLLLRSGERQAGRSSR